MPRGLIVSAPASGSGKTTLTLGLIRALRRHGLAVQPFKSGPDYIDPAFHGAAAGRASCNLDSWAMPAAMIGALIGGMAPFDLAIVEGSMGLFDGVAKSGESGNGASADIAAATGWPVILVIDSSGQAQSAAAVARGFASMRADVRLAGTIANRVASPRHESLLRHGFDMAGVPVLGMLPRKDDLAMPSRHLGLVQAAEQPELEERIERMADWVTAHCELDRIAELATPFDPKSGRAGDTGFAPPPGQRIAIARDEAFSFVYPHMLEHWRRQGAQILPFSPLADQGPAEDADVCWLPGGYPELHAGRLAQAEHFRRQLKRFALSRPVHGECGGYMAMGEALIDKEGQSHRMAGLLGLVTSYADRRMHLGYRLAQLSVPMPGLARGSRLRGHEFHYSTIVQQPDEPLARVVDAQGETVPETGSRRGLATGSFFHLIGRAS